MASILNAAGNALKAIGTVGNLGNDNNILAQPSTTLLGVNVPGVPLVSFRDYFITTMESWITALPLRTQFVAIIHSFPPGLNTSLIQSLELTDPSKKDFDISKAKNLLTAYPLQKVVGCMFLQGINIPSETLSVEAAPISNNRGFVQGTVLGNRTPFASMPLSLQFLETNTSFADFVMRPWLILASHAGFVARKSDDPKNPKVNITLIQFTRSYQKVSQVPRKIWNFYGCVPIGIDKRDMTYEKESIDQYTVNFAYDHYGIQNTLYLPLPDLINRISKFEIPRISPFQR